MKLPRIHKILFTLYVVAFCIMSPLLHAQQATLEQRAAALEQRLATIETRLGIKPPTTPTATPEPAPHPVQQPAANIKLLLVTDFVEQESDELMNKMINDLPHNLTYTYASLDVWVQDLEEQTRKKSNYDVILNMFTLYGTRASESGLKYIKRGLGQNEYCIIIQHSPLKLYEFSPDAPDRLGKEISLQDVAKKITERSQRAASPQTTPPTLQTSNAAKPQKSVLVIDFADKEAAAPLMRAIPTKLAQLGMGKLSPEVMNRQIWSTLLKEGKRKKSDYLFIIHACAYDGRLNEEITELKYKLDNNEYVACIDFAGGAPTPSLSQLTQPYFHIKRDRGNFSDEEITAMLTRIQQDLASQQ